MSAEPRATGAERFAWLGVVLLTAAALALRLATLDFALPFVQEPDAHIVGQVEALSQDVVTDRDIFYSSIYPHLFARTAMVFGDVTRRPDAIESYSLDEHLAAASRLHLRVREVIAWLSVLSVPATYWVARAFVERRWALFAAALAATSTLSLQFGQMARPHAAAAPLMVLAVAAALRLRRAGDTRSFALAGATAALAVAALQSAVLVLLAGFAAYVMRARAVGWRRYVDWRLLLPLVLLAAAVRAFWPYLFVEAPPDAAASSGAPDVEPSLGPLVRFALALGAAALGVLGLAVESVRVERNPRLRYASIAIIALGGAAVWAMRDATLYVGWQTIDLRDFQGEGFPTLFMTLWFYEPVGSVLALAGVAAWLLRKRESTPQARERRMDLLVVLAFALVYALAFGLMRRNQQRFALPLVPFVAVLAAYGLRAITQAPRSRRLALPLALLTLAVPAAACLAYTRMRREPQTLELAADWLRARSAERGSVRAAIHPLYDVPLPRRRENLFAADGSPRKVTFSPWLVYQSRWMQDAWRGERWDVESLYAELAERPAIQADPDAYVRSLDVDYVILPGGDGVGVNPLVRAVRGALDRAGRKVLELPAESRPPPSGLEGLDTPHFTWFVLTHRWFGPALDVYELPRAR